MVNPNTERGVFQGFSPQTLDICVGMDYNEYVSIRGKRINRVAYVRTNLDADRGSCVGTISAGISSKRRSSKHSVGFEALKALPYREGLFPLPWRSRFPWGTGGGFPKVTIVYEHSRQRKRHKRRSHVRYRERARDENEARSSLGPSEPER